MRFGFPMDLAVSSIGPLSHSDGSLSGMGSSDADTTPVENYRLARHRTLQVAVSSLLVECGFHSAEKAAVESLTEMMQSYISKIGRCAKAYCEHTARSVPNLSDAVITLVEMGLNIDTLSAYAKRSQRTVIAAPPAAPDPPATPKSLAVGRKRPHPSYIPHHYPEFPDPHTYIRTAIFREPVSDYQALREKAATRRRDLGCALARFMAKTGETQSLFKDDVSAFPLIAACPSSVPYLSALLPSELEPQWFGETEQDEQMDVESTAGNSVGDEPAANSSSRPPLTNAVPSTRASDDNVVDNPFLRLAKKPKVKRKK